MPPVKLTLMLLPLFSAPMTLASPDTDAMTAAFTEYTQRQVKKASRPSILQKLELLKAQIRQPKKEKVRNREPER